MVTPVITYACIAEKVPASFDAAGPVPAQVIVLFQQQDGVDVCLYCIYVQEYGEDCPAPNRFDAHAPLLLMTGRQPGFAFVCASALQQSACSDWRGRYDGASRQASFLLRQFLRRISLQWPGVQYHDTFTRRIPKSRLLFPSSHPSVSCHSPAARAHHA